MKRPAHAQRGATLVVALVMLVLITLLGLSAMQLSQLGERNARADRDRQIALQSAEAALRDAWLDIDSGLRASRYSNAPVGFIDDCSTEALPADAAAAATSRRGWCLGRDATAARQLWQDVDFNARGVPFGTFTSRAWDNTSGAVPMYIIESVPLSVAGTAVQSSSSDPDQLAFRVTAVGFGPPGSNTQVALQSYYVRFR